MLKAASRRIPTFFKPISILALNHRTSRGGRPKGWRVLRHFGLKTGIHFAYFGLESGMVFEGTTGVYELFIVYRKKDKYANSKWMSRNPFCCCSNLSNLMTYCFRDQV